MEDLERALIGEQPLQLGRVIGSGKLHQRSAAVALGELHEAEPVAIGIEAHRLGVDADRAAGEAPWGQVALIEFDGRGLAQLEALLGGRIMDARRLKKREWCPGEDSNFHALSGTST